MLSFSGDASEDEKLLFRVASQYGGQKAPEGLRICLDILSRNGWLGKENSGGIGWQPNGVSMGDLRHQYREIGKILSNEHRLGLALVGRDGVISFKGSNPPTMMNIKDIGLLDGHGKMIVAVSVGAFVVPVTTRTLDSILKTTENLESLSAVNCL